MMNRVCGRNHVPDARKAADAPHVNKPRITVERDRAGPNGAADRCRGGGRRLVRGGGCFRIPPRAVSGGASRRGDRRAPQSFPGGTAGRRRGRRMPYMLISTQIRLVRKPRPPADPCHGSGRRRRARVGDPGEPLVRLRDVAHAKLISQGQRSQVRVVRWPAVPRTLETTSKRGCERSKQRAYSSVAFWFGVFHFFATVP